MISLFFANKRGYILLPVVMTLTLLALIAFMLNRHNGVALNMAASRTESDQAVAVADAGMAHALWHLAECGCGPYSDLTDVSFGNHLYSATITPNNAGGQIISYNVPVSDDTYIKEDTPSQTYGNDAQLHTYYKFLENRTQRTLYRFDLENSGIPAGAQVVSAIARLFVVDTNDLAPVTVHRVTADWTEDGVTWDSIAMHHDSSSLASIPTGSPAGQAVAVNITSLVQAWLNDSTTNQGIMLKTTWSDDLAQFTSKEYGNIDQRPELVIKVSDGSLANRAGISVTGTLDNGVSRTLERNDEVLYQSPPNTLDLQPGATEGKDVYIYQWKQNWNHGAHVNLVVAHGFDDVSHSLLRFNLGTVPAGARVMSASLELYSNTNSWGSTTIDVHRLSMDWEEGDESGGTGPGANWTERQTGVAWGSAGGDYEPGAAAGAVTPGGLGWVTWDVTDLVNDWVSGRSPNYGFLLAPTENYKGAEFDSSDATDPTTHPRLTITYTCECGVACQAPQGLGNVLLVVGDDTTLDPADDYKKTVFESWGYTVAVIDDNADQSTFDSTMVGSDVAYISETVYGPTLSDKLVSTTRGVVNEEGDLFSQFGTSSSYAYSVGKAMEIVDTSHYITEIFPGAVLPIYAAPMEGLSAAGVLAADLQVLGNFNGAPGLAVVEKGGLLADGSSAAGRRITLPLGRDGEANFNWNYLNNNGRLIVQRALEWGGTSSDVICTSGNFRDEFASVTFSNSDGSLEWSGDWLEHDDGGSGPSTGKAVITGGMLRLNGPLTTIAAFPSGEPTYFPSLIREMDLSVHQSAILSFFFATGSGVEASEDSVVVEISGNGGTTWNVLENFDAFAGENNGVRSYDITLYMAADTQVRFRINAAYGGPNEYFYVDDVNVTAGCDPSGGGGGTFRDEFNAKTFSGSDGSHPWSIDWQEIGESDGPTKSDVIVLNDVSDFQLQVRDNDNGGEGVEREVDLSRAATATLSFDSRRVGLDDSGDYVKIEVSANGAAGPWTELGRLAGPDNDTTYQAAGYDISAYISGNTRIRIITSPTMGNLDLVRFDNIEISFSQ